MRSEKKSAGHLVAFEKKKESRPTSCRPVPRARSLRSPLSRRDCTRHLASLKEVWSLELRFCLTRRSRTFPLLSFCVVCDHHNHSSPSPSEYPLPLYPRPSHPGIALSTLSAVAWNMFGAIRETRIFGTLESTCRADGAARGRRRPRGLLLLREKKQPLLVLFLKCSSFCFDIALKREASSHRTMSHKQKSRATSGTCSKTPFLIHLEQFFEVISLFCPLERFGFALERRI